MIERSGEMSWLIENDWISYFETSKIIMKWKENGGEMKCLEKNHQKYERNIEEMK